MSKSLELDCLRDQAKNVRYAVRGKLLQKATQLSEDIRNGTEKRIKKVHFMNIGDAQATGLVKPSKYIRMIASQVMQQRDDCPKSIAKIADEFLSACKSYSAGSYSQSLGNEVCRQAVCDFIDKRDGECGPKCEPDTVFLGNGASDCIETVVSLLDPGKNHAVMIPIPQYPLYTALLQNYGLKKLEYFLDEDRGWGVTREELERSFNSDPEAVPKAIVVINPGNPTGQILSREDIEEIICFARDKKLTILADEVYQFNIYNGQPFNSFRKVLREMGDEFRQVTLASFLSISKGLICECGLRGGYCQMENVDKNVQGTLTTLRSARLCPNTLGQAVLYALLRMPEKPDEMFAEFEAEKLKVYHILKQNAGIVSKSLNEIQGITCNEIQGAMYAFPQVTLTQKVIEEAGAAGVPPDEYYCLRLLESTGICVVPGSGFGQRPDTFHFRMTILLQADDLKDAFDAMKSFNKSFLL